MDSKSSQNLDDSKSNIEELMLFQGEQSSPYERYKHLSLDKLDQFKFKKGKHEGKTFKEVLDNDVKYCKWTLKNSNNELSLMYLFKSYLERYIEEKVKN